MPDLETLEKHRKARFQHLRIRESRIGHVTLNGIGAGKALPLVVDAGAGAAADGLVVLIAIVAPDEVIHGALGGRIDTERAQQRVGDRLADLGITGHHRRRILR